MNAFDDLLTRLPQWLCDLLNNCPTAGDGVHFWIFRCARHLLAHFDQVTTFELLKAKAARCGRPAGKLEREILIQIQGALSRRWCPRNPAAFAQAAGVPCSQLAPSPAPNFLLPIPRPWPPPDLAAIEQIVSGEILLADLVERSPLKFSDDASHAEQIIDILFPSDQDFEPLLCVGKSKYRFATRRRHVWRGHLARLPLIVPNPMLDYFGPTQDGHPSQHSLANTARRIYLVVEFDFAEFGRDGKTPSCWAPLVRAWRERDLTVTDACAALHLHLAERLALVCCVHSGGKSLHGWFRAFDRSKGELRHFMEYAVRLGADRATWTESQFVRIPDGLRENGKRQRCLYLNPREAVQI